MSEPSDQSPPVQHYGSQVVRASLGRSTDVDSCLALVGEVDRMLMQAADHLQSAEVRLACRAGCSFCCHLQVRVLPHEAIALFRYLQSQMEPELATRVRERIRERLRTRSDASASRACAFLIEGECAAYEARPSACAAYHSISRERCEQAFQDPDTPSGTVALQALQIVAVALEEGVRAGLATEGLDAAAIELHTAVAALLANPALIARWRAGRPLLKSP